MECILWALDKFKLCAGKSEASIEFQAIILHNFSYFLSSWINTPPTLLVLGLPALADNTAAYFSASPTIDSSRRGTFSPFLPSE